MNQKNRLGFSFDVDLKAFTSRVFDIGGFAEKVRHDV